MFRQVCNVSLLALASIGGLRIATAGESIALTNEQSSRSNGEAFLENGERDKAIDAFTEAIRLDPKQARIYYLRASVYQRIGDAKRQRPI